MRRAGLVFLSLGIVFIILAALGHSNVCYGIGGLYLLIAFIINRRADQ